MTTPLRPARRIVLRSVPAPVTEARLRVVAAPPDAGAAHQADAAQEDDSFDPTRDSVIPDSFIRDLRAVLTDPAIPREAPLPDLSSWLEHAVPELLAASSQGTMITPADWSEQLALLEDHVRAMYAARPIHAVLDRNAPLEDSPIPAPPLLSIWRWLWLAVFGG